MVTVELGVDYGYSSFSLCIDNPGTVYGIDTFEGDEHAGHRDVFELVLQKKNELKFVNLEIIKNTFENVARTWNKPIDILHIDGLHTYEAVKRDYDTWSPFVRDGGVILMHDIEAFGDVKRVYNESDWFKMAYHHSAGLGVLSKDESLIKTIGGWTVV